MMDDELIAYFQKFNHQKITLDTRLYHDLGIFGGDLLEILKYFEEKYSVDFKSLDYNIYFPDERDMFILKIWWNRIRRKKNQEKKAITIKHMVEVVKQKKWFDPVIL